MARIEGMYDTQADVSSGFDVMPEHQATAAIVESDFKTTASGTGKFIALTWELLDGPHKGRKLWANLNIKNDNAKAQQIGNAEFASVRVALFGTKDKAVLDTAELHGLPCKVTIGCRKRKDTGEMENFIKKYTNLNAVATAPATAPATGGPKPW